LYAAIAILALLATWHQNLTYFGAGDPLTGTIRFWRETLATPASVSITVDLFLFGLAVVVWMVLEARRLSIPHVWIYVLGGALSAISVSVPLFLIARGRCLQADNEAPGALTAGDLVGLGLFALPGLALAMWSLLH